MDLRRVDEICKPGSKRDRLSLLKPDVLTITSKVNQWDKNPE